MNNTKQENFKRIATNRVNKIIDLISKLQNLSNSSFYEYTDEQINQIFSTIQAELDKQKKEFQKDTFIQEILGEDLSRKYIEAKTSEYQDYRIQITDWELEKYLHLL